MTDCLPTYEVCARQRKRELEERRQLEGERAHTHTHTRYDHTPELTYAAVYLLCEEEEDDDF